MNEKKAKQLRKQIFGDIAFRGTKIYVALHHDKKPQWITRSDGSMVMRSTVTIGLAPGTAHHKYRHEKRIQGRVR